MRTALIAFLLIASVVVIPGSLQAFNTRGELIHVRYEASNESFANPERGLPMRIDPPWATDAKGKDLKWDDVPWDFCGSGNNFSAYNHSALTTLPNLETLKAGRARGQTLVMVRFHIAAFRNSELSSGFLNGLTKAFATVREAGVKIVPRFAYNYSKGGPDAPLERILRHLDQLKPVLNENADVIAFMDAGLIGCWGEMHTSSNGFIDDSQGYRRLTDSGRKILEKLFETLPARRMVTVRYPEYKFQYFNSRNANAEIANAPSQPISGNEAFTGSIKARWAHNDDCVVCGEWNGGTYENPHSIKFGKASEVKNFLEQDMLYGVNSGELGAAYRPVAGSDEDGDGWQKDHDACKRVLPLFAKVRFSTFNHNDDAATVERWKKEACFEQIAQRLGYRFELLEANMPDNIKPGSSFNMNFIVQNDGWAAPYNPRLLEINLQNTTSGKVFNFRLEGKRANNEDPRFWQPGKKYTVQVEAGLPSDMPAGNYRVGLVLPDPEPKLYDRAEYAIRLANKNVWQTTGVNDLRHVINVNANVAGTAHKGSSWFR